MTKFRVTWIPNGQVRIIKETNLQNAWHTAFSIFHGEIIDLLRPNFSVNPYKGLQATFAKVIMTDYLKVEQIVQPILKVYFEERVFTYEITDTPITSLTVVHPSLNSPCALDFETLNSWIIPSIANGSISYFGMIFAPTNEAFSVSRLEVVPS